MLTELLIMLGIKGINDGLKALDSRDKAHFGAYYDGNGVLRYKGRRIVRTFDNNGDEVYEDLSSGKIYVNLSREYMKEAEKEAYKNGQKYFLRQVGRGYSKKRLGIKEIWGDRYCKVFYPRTTSTGNVVYVKRRINYTNKHFSYSGEFYMGASFLNQYKLIEPTESTREIDLKVHGEQVEEFYKLLYILFDYHCNKFDWWKDNVRDTPGPCYLNEVPYYDDTHRKISRWR